MSIDTAAIPNFVTKTLSSRRFDHVTATRPVMIIIRLMQFNASYLLIFFNLDIHTVEYCASTCRGIDRVYDSTVWRLHGARMDDVIPALQVYIGHRTFNMNIFSETLMMRTLSSFFSTHFRQCRSCGSWMRLVRNKQIAWPVRREGIKINLSRPGSNIVVYADDNRALAVNAT